MAILAAVVSLALASAGASYDGDSTPHTCDSHSARWHYKAAKQTADVGFAKRNWRSGPKGSQLRQIRDHLGCLERAKDRKKIKGLVAQKRSALRLYRAYRRITDVRCTGGPWGYWVAIASNTCACIGQESGFSWSADNPTSSARGAYQLLGHGEPWPANTRRRQLAHHRIAESLSPSAWVAPTCG